MSRLLHGAPEEHIPTVVAAHLYEVLMTILTEAPEVMSEVSR
jgi:hypothetical protein